MEAISKFNEACGLMNNPLRLFSVLLHRPSLIKTEGFRLKYYILNKPYGYLSQFTDEAGHPGLNKIINVPKQVYAVGRLDHDSEGLLLLSDDKYLNKNLLDPEQKHYRTYNVLVDGLITDTALESMRKGVTIRIAGADYHTLPAEAKAIDPPDFPDRPVPVRVRKHIPYSWIELTLTEGKNRQVRKMTAVVGHPTLRLIRMAIEGLTLEGLSPGEIKEISRQFAYEKLKL